MWYIFDELKYIFYDAENYISNFYQNIKYENMPMLNK